MKIVLDSSVLVSLFNDKDPHHQKAQEIFQKVLYGEYHGVLASLSLPEVCGSISRILEK